MDFNLFFSRIGVSPSIMQGITFLAIIILVSLAFGMFIGRFRLVTILVNIYISVAILKAIPSGYFSDYSYSLVFFFILLIALTLASKKFFEVRISGSGSSFLWRIFSLSFLEIMLLISIILTLMPKKIALEYVSKTIYQYVASPDAYLFWLVMPLIGLFLVRKKLNR